MELLRFGDSSACALQGEFCDQVAVLLRRECMERIARLVVSSYSCGVRCSVRHSATAVLAEQLVILAKPRHPLSG